VRPLAPPSPALPLTFRQQRIYFGKTKLLARALGLTPADALLPGLDRLAPHARAGLGLIMTARAPGEVLSHFSAYSAPDYARAGATAPRRFALPRGRLFSRAGEVAEEEDVAVEASAEAALRRLGVPVAMDRGEVVLADEYVVCEEGQVLDGRQTALLKMFGVTMVDFRVAITAYWEAETGRVVEVGK
jgi:mRNA turnover protein 4